MGDLIPFRKPKPQRWTRAEDYGRVLSTSRWRGQPSPPRGPRGGRLGRVWNAVRPWMMLIALAVVWYGYDVETIEPWGVLQSEPQTIAGSFTRCDEAANAFCVVDGDTFRLGDTRVRLLGVDAPETHPANCPAEAMKGAQVTAALQRLLNQGPFELVGRVDGMTDKYGRQLRSAYRVRPDGTRQTIAEDLLASGTVRRYTGGARAPWC